MKTILVPIDFSTLSKVAVLYAARLAKKLNADIILLTVIDISNAETLLKPKKLEDEMIKTAQQDAGQLIREIKTQVKGIRKLSFRYIIGFPFDTMIEHFVTHNGIDLIVMGTKGATGLKKVLIGSNATAVMNNSSVPVIAVPAHARFKMKKIVYAADLENLRSEIKTIALFAKLFDAEVNVLHVLANDSSKKIDDKNVAADLIKQTRYSKISFHVSKNGSVVDAVDTFVKKQKADMLAMFTHKLDFYEKLFGKSVTRQVAFHNKLPLLSLNKTTLL